MRQILGNILAAMRSHPWVSSSWAVISSVFLLVLTGFFTNIGEKSLSALHDSFESLSGIKSLQTEVKRLNGELEKYKYNTNENDDRASENSSEKNMQTVSRTSWISMFNTSPIECREKIREWAKSNGYVVDDISPIKNTEIDVKDSEHFVRIRCASNYFSPFTYAFFVYPIGSEEFSEILWQRLKSFIRTESIRENVIFPPDAKKGFGNDPWNEPAIHQEVIEITLKLEGNDFSDWKEEQFFPKTFLESIFKDQSFRCSAGSKTPNYCYSSQPMWTLTLFSPQPFTFPDTTNMSSKKDINITITIQALLSSNLYGNSNEYSDDSRYVGSDIKNILSNSSNVTRVEQIVSSR